VDLTECLKALVNAAERVNRGDLGEAEALLMAQAVTLNAMFTQLANQSIQSQYVEHLDRYMRLALKAQGQCRATLETLAAIKNPPTVFARQANIAQGLQQVATACFQRHTTPDLGLPVTKHSGLCLVKRSFLLQELKLRSTMDTLSSHDIGPRFVPPDPPNSDAFAR
jgi:hypothetical protein